MLYDLFHHLCIYLTLELKHKRKAFDSGISLPHSLQPHWFTHFDFTQSHPLSLWDWFLFFLFLPYRCLLFWPLYHHHLCQCRSSSDGTSDASFPNSLQAKLHSTGLPVTTAVHHRAPSLQRKPIPGGICSQILPLQRCRPQLLFSHLHSGRELL